MNTTVLTSVYSHFEDANSSTVEFYKSAERCGHPVYNVHAGEGGFKGNGRVLLLLYRAFLKFKEEGHTHLIYADGADSFFTRTLHVPADNILFSAEQAMWPPSPDLTVGYKDHVENWGKTPWKWLNGGGWCGPIDLLIKFWETSGLHRYSGIEINGQLELAESFLVHSAMEEKVRLDQDCEHFQSIGHCHPHEQYFGIAPKRKTDPVTLLCNKITGTIPALWHGNGRTSMKWIYDIYK